MRKTKARSRGKRAYQLVFLGFSLICILTGIFCFQYYDSLRGTIQDESEGYLQEISSRIGSNISRSINDNYAMLNTLASILESSGAKSYEEMEPIVETQKSYWNCRDVIFIEKSGNAYTTSGRKTALNNDTYFTKAIVNKSEGIYATQMIDDEECIMLAVQLENNIEVEGSEMVALGAVYAPDAFEQMLSMSAFNDQAFSTIISKSGTVISRPVTTASKLNLGYNVINTISNAQLSKGSSISQMKTDITNDISGQIEFAQNGIRYYAIYTPIDPEDWYLLTFVPVSVVNEKSDMLLTVTIVLCSLVALVFVGLLAALWFTFYRNRKNLERIAYVDDITNGNTIQKFYVLAKIALEASHNKNYVLVYTNLKKFKVMNDQFGRRVCNEVLMSFYNNIDSGLKDGECIGRISGDNFCILLRYHGEKDLLGRFEQWFADAEARILEKKPVWSLPITEFGVYIIDGEDISFPQMIDRAKLALKESVHYINSKLCYAIYDDEVRKQILREKQLEDMMDTALRNKEFQVYLQPKYHLPEERIKGAEALTRWVSASEGMIFPDEFIPLFEKNGFVIQLDLYVFKEVCRKLREWLDAGYEPVKVSVNCSRAHLKNKDFLREYRVIMERFQIPDGLLEIELTESLVMGDTKRLIQVIEEIRSMGLGCSMDDFGSGYSSLNLIQSIPVDTIKLDKIFFKNHLNDSERMESVVDCIVKMAKALSIDTVAEGVEYKDQVEMLKRIGCDYIQGYIFAKPMPIPSFEELAFESRKKEVEK